MRAWLGAIAALGLAACTPQIESGAYFCGPSEQCPPELACDGETSTCVQPANVSAFTCTEGPSLPTPGCGPDAIGSNGCVLTADAHDQITFQSPACVVMATVMITYSEGFMPLTVTVRDGAGATIGTSAPCHSVHGGDQDACIEFATLVGENYTFDVAATSGASTCGGACGFNRFDLSVVQQP